MDGRIVQRLRTAAHPEEAGALLKNLASQARHAEQGLATGKCPWALRC